MAASNELIDSLLADYKKPEDLIGEHGRLEQPSRKLIEHALGAEMAEHLGHARNGHSRKTLKGEFGEMPIEVPRATTTIDSSRRSPPNIKPAGRALLAESCGSMPEA